MVYERYSVPTADQNRVTATLLPIMAAVFAGFLLIGLALPYCRSTFTAGSASARS